MKIELYAENPTKTFVRQAADYEAVGLDPQMTIIMPVTIDDDRESIEAKGINWAGLMRQIGQVFRENIGNSFGALIRTAVAKNLPLPTQADLDELVTNYDFSGARSVSETSLSEAERTFRSILRSRLKDLLRIGTFSEESLDPQDEPLKLTVQTQKEASAESLPDGKISIEDFESLIEAAADGAIFTFEERSYDFSGEPEFELDEDNNILSYNNLAAVPAHCQELAEAKLAQDRRTRGVRASIPRG